MKVRQWITAIVLLLLVAAAIVGLVWTRALPAPSDETSATPGKKCWGTEGAGGAAPAGGPASAADGAADGGDGGHAGRTGAGARGGKGWRSRSRSGVFRCAADGASRILHRFRRKPSRLPIARTKAEQTLKDDQENIALLTRKLAAAPEAQKDNLQDQIDVAKAQMDLDQDELDDAAEDLEQAGGDPQSKIKRLQAEHEAGDHNAAAAGFGVNPHEQDYQARTLLNVFRAWQALREKKAQLQDARDETIAKQEYLTKKHADLAAQVEKDKENRDAAKQQAKGFAARSSKAASRDESKASAKAALDSLKQYTLDQRNLADRGRRLQDEQELNDTYASWIALVEDRERVALHNLIECLLWILLVLMAVYLAHRLIERLFTGMTAENKRIDTLRAVVKFAAQAVGAIVIAFIIFGMPTQTTTVLGLAGAGLTVAMKDFIVAFFGWFVLMGKNGIRVGDWVEINGVAGEVIEIGLLKTILLETGNWTDAGHPTGRRVSFVNSFAIEGHFFNFTTSGQWMWDELKFSIPSGDDPYPVIDGMQQLGTKETEENAQQSGRRVGEVDDALSGAVVLGDAGDQCAAHERSGVEVSVRYITRAYDRHETRKRMYAAVVELMHGKRDAVKQEAAGS